MCNVKEQTIKMYVYMHLHICDERSINDKKMENVRRLGLKLHRMILNTVRYPFLRIPMDKVYRIYLHVSAFICHQE